MRYTAYHGSEGHAFKKFDPARTGSGSGYRHAVGMASFTGDLGLAEHYAGGSGFIGRFAFRLENPLELHDRERGLGFASLIEHARNLGHDGVIIRACEHTGIAPTGPADIYFVFDLEAPSLVEVIQDGPPEPDLETPTSIARRRSR